MDNWKLKAHTMVRVEAQQGKCQVCNYTFKGEAEWHRHYVEFGSQRLKDMVVVCELCLGIVRGTAYGAETRAKARERLVERFGFVDPSTPNTSTSVSAAPPVKMPLPVLTAEEMRRVAEVEAMELTPPAPRESIYDRIARGERL